VLAAQSTQLQELGSKLLGTAMRSAQKAIKGPIFIAGEGVGWWGNKRHTAGVACAGAGQAGCALMRRLRGR
jgi:hypothetical protein